MTGAVASSDQASEMRSSHSSSGAPTRARNRAGYGDMLDETVRRAFRER